MHRGIPSLHVLLIASIVVLLAPDVRPARAVGATPLVAVVYIAADGDDSRDCAAPATRCATLQRALDQLAEGGEARLAAGKYAGMAGLERSATIAGGYTLPDFGVGDALTVLDGQHQGTTLRIDGAAWARLERLTITGGLADPAGTASGRGGGIYARGVSVTLDRVQIAGNIADAGGSGRGGGLYIRDGDLTLTNSAVMSNTASLIIPATTVSGTVVTGSGGGIYAINTRLAIGRSRLAGNSAIGGDVAAPIATRGWGGGLYASGCALDAQEAVFLGNDALGSSSGGGAIRLINSRTHLLGGEISDNQAGRDPLAASGGGGIDILSGTTTLADVALRRNTATSGAGLRLRPATKAVSPTAALTLTNVLLAEHSGAALALLPNAGGAARAELRHATLISNSIGLLAGAGQAISVTNSLIAGSDTAAQALGGAIALAYTDRYGNLQDAQGDVRIGAAGDLALPPGFVPGDTAFHLALDSPLRDQGAAIAGVGADFEGQPRIADSDGDGVALPDLGWDELARSAALFGSDQTHFAQPGQMLTTTLELYNAGQIGDIFTIGVTAPRGWGASIASSEVTLLPCESAILTITIAVPAGAPLNSQGRLAVQAAGQTSAATALIEVNVGEP